MRIYKNKTQETIFNQKKNGSESLNKKQHISIEIHTSLYMQADQRWLEQRTKVFNLHCRSFNCPWILFIEFGGDGPQSSGAGMSLNGRPDEPSEQESK